MKGRDSGMPEETYWATFFGADAAVARLLGDVPPPGDVVEFGCGYGTFTLGAARRTRGHVTALDIEPDLVAHVRGKAAEAGLTNIAAEARDFVAEGTGLAAASQAHAMIYNLLHLERPVDLLIEARRVLCKDGRLSVMHWRSDIPTPRGPPLSIRPTPDQCREWMAQAGFARIEHVDIADSCPYHFAVTATR